MSDVLVLCYHAVSERWDSTFAIRPEVLERQLRFLLDRGYRGATFTDAVTSSPRGRTLAVTFDDGMRSVAAVAHPILKALGLPGTVFVCTDFVGQDRPMPLELDTWLGTAHESELLPMSWDQLAQLRDDGWEVGSHSASHVHLTDIDDDDLAGELLRSRAEIDGRLNGTCTSLAYPFGDCDARVASAAGAAGYVAAGTIHGGRRSSGPLQSPRVVVYGHDSWWRFTTKVSRPGRSMADAPGWETVRQARARLRAASGRGPR